MGAYQRTIWPNGLTTLLRRAGDQRQYEALRAFYMEELSSSVKVRGGTAEWGDAASDGRRHRPRAGPDGRGHFQQRLLERLRHLRHRGRCAERTGSCRWFFDDPAGGRAKN